MNLLEFIESNRPCDLYHDYIRVGTLNEDTTLRDIICGGITMSNDSKLWLVDSILPAGCYFDLEFLVSQRGDMLTRYRVRNSNELLRILQEIIDNDPRELYF